MELAGLGSLRPYASWAHMSKAGRTNDRIARSFSIVCGPIRLTTRKVLSLGRVSLIRQSSIADTGSVWF